ncbi:MAG: hypothetical protein Q8M95_11340 [Candidatus Methanoperedens sp.]|nr:hypothetical protein [Candidatus Methanoperedens sp.]
MSHTAAKMIEKGLKKKYPKIWERVIQSLMKKLIMAWVAEQDRLADQVQVEESETNKS